VSGTESVEGVSRSRVSGTGLIRPCGSRSSRTTAYARRWLRRNKVADGGNLYKVVWFGQGLIGTHDPRTNRRSGHKDLIEIVALLEKSKRDPDAQWAVIREHFDVDQVATHFAVNIVLSHWDGFFNNYFAYHDTKRGKWQLYPWDHDRTWGDGDSDVRPLIDLPVTFGMEGAVPPRPARANNLFDNLLPPPFQNALQLTEDQEKQLADVQKGAEAKAAGLLTDAQRKQLQEMRSRGPFGGGPGWWRPGGVFSRPLLANPHFRKVFLARIREIVRDDFTEEAFDPLIDDLAARLSDDAALRAKSRGQVAEAGRRQVSRAVKFLKTFLRERREYLLK
jgi:spore coat protein CotH